MKNLVLIESILWYLKHNSFILCPLFCSSFSNDWFILERIDTLKFSCSACNVCNICNIWENDLIPADYHDVLSKTHFDKYIDLFHTNYKTISLLGQFDWMKQASDLNNLTGTVSKLFDDDLEALDSLPINSVFDNKPYFVRTNNVSLKTGLFGTGPFYTLREVVIGIITSSASHDPLNGSGIYYLLPWIELEYFLEFRVFVYSRKITAISQQHLYEIPPNPISDDSYREYIKRLDTFFNTVVKHKINLDTYSFDVGFTKDNKVYFIEANTFGATYAAGSSLFHWKNDSELLGSDKSGITVRVRS